MYQLHAVEFYSLILIASYIYTNIDDGPSLASPLYWVLVFKWRFELPHPLEFHLRTLPMVREYLRRHLQ